MSSYTCRSSIWHKGGAVSISQIYFWNLFESSFKNIPQNADSLEMFFVCGKTLGVTPWIAYF